MNSLLKKCLGAALLFYAFSACTPGVEKSRLVSVKTFNYPILKGKTDNPFVRICYNAVEDETINSFSLDLDTINPEDVQTVRIYNTRQDSIFKTDMLYGTSKEGSDKSIIEGEQTIEKGVNYFWISLELTPNVNLNSSVSVQLNYIQTETKRLSPAELGQKVVNRFGVAVRQHNEDNVHTYRIPGLTTTKSGTLLAVYDVRRDSGRDLQGHMDIGVSRSTDGGASWEPMRIALDMGEWGGLPEKFNGVSDANILVDSRTGDIYIAGLWMHGVIDANGVWQENLTESSDNWNHQWRTKGSQPGYGVKESSQFLITKSTDDGQTWSSPVNITEMCKKEEWWLWAPAPGHGITLSDGTLVFPTQGRDKDGVPFSNITYSKDGGESWITSSEASHNTTESMAVQLSDNTIMLNMRDNRNRQEKGDKNGRAIAVTNDLGKTWTEHSTSHSALIEPVCMASIHKHEFSGEDGNKRSILLFSNPNSKYKRIKQTIKVSLDEGLTWPERYWIELDEGGGAGYSCLTSVDENRVGILYEGSQAHMTFQSIDISEIIAEIK